MAVIDITETTDADYTPSKSGRTAKRTFTVKLDGTDTAAAAPFVAVRASAGGVRVPRVGETHPNDPWLIVGNIAPKRIGHGILWEITVNYATKSTTGTGGGTGADNPLEEPPRISESYRTTVEPIDTDTDGNPIVNSALEPFDPPLSEEVVDRILTISHNRIDRIRDLEDFQGSVNADDVKVRGETIRAGTARIFITQDEVFVSKGFSYYATQFEITIREKGQMPKLSQTWERRLLDQGFREYLGRATLAIEGVVEIGDPLYANFVDQNGKQITEPTKLDGKGGKLKDKANPVWLYYKTKRKKSWVALNPP